MRQEFKGFLKIFSFTFRQHVKSRGYRMSGIVIGLLCLILPVTIMFFTGRPRDDSNNVPDVTWEEESTISENVPVKNEKIHNIYVVDKAEAYQKEGNSSDWYSSLNLVGDGFTDLNYEAFSDVDSAAEAAEGKGGTLLLVAEQGAYGLELSVLLPEDSDLTEDDAWDYENFLAAYYPVVQMKKAGLSEGTLAELSRPVDMEIISGDETEESDASGSSEEAADGDSMEEDVSMMVLKDILSMALPYVTIMVLYFMILAYGQGVANSVIMEKNSKLMDTFLVTVRPGAMIMGKVLAIAASGLLQLFVWAICLAGSFAAGTMIVKTINPETDMLLIRLFDTFGELSAGLFSITGILFTILILIGGFLLYCALAAVGGAIASKPEDLSTTNILFTMALVISFLLALSGGALQGELDSTSWMLYMPFTALLVAPGMALLGEMSIIQCILSLAIILLAALIVIWAAGRIYKMLIFHKGAPLSVRKVLKMLAGNKKSSSM